MVMTGMEKLQNFQYPHPEPVRPHTLENVRDDLEDDPLPLVCQFFLTLCRDLLVDVFLPTEDLDHANDVHDLSYNLNTRVRLQKNEIELCEVNKEARPTIFIFSVWTSCILEAIHPGRG